MAERTPSKPASTCRLWSKRAASLKCRLDRLKQEFNKKVETMLGEFASKESVGGYPVPMSPPTPADNAPFPKPATPPGGCARTPVGQHDYEASGSNHTSNHTSEYFDAKDPLEYVLQHQIPNYAEFQARLRNRKQYGSEHSQQGFEHSQLGSELSQFGSEHPQLGFEYPQFGNELYQDGFEHPQPGIEHLQQGFEPPHLGLEEQLAGSFDDMLLNTPSASHASHPHPHPWDDHPFLNPVSPVSVHHHLDPPVPEYYYSGELNPGWLQLDDVTGSHATSVAQQQQQTTTTPPGYGGMSVRTGETGDSRESLMDTAGTSTTSPYILPPVAEEKPSILHMPFNKIYVELRRFARGDEVAFQSARMGRGMRVLGRAFCYTLRLRKTVMRVKLAKAAQRKRIRERESQRPQKPRQQCMKRMRAAVVPTQPTTPGVSTQSTTERPYKGITFRNGNWNAEIRVSGCKAKVWIGTFSSEKEAALALDAGYYHCTEKRKTFNFPQFVNQLGESQYRTVLALINEERKDEATKLVKTRAVAHAAAFGAP